MESIQVLRFIVYHLAIAQQALQGAARLEQCSGTICNGGHTLLWNSS